MGLNRFEQLRHYISETEGHILSVSGFARLLGVSISLMAGIERGGLPPSPKVASRLEKKYGISKEWYLTGEGEAPWEKKDYEDFFKLMDKFVLEGKKDEIPPLIDKRIGCYFAGERILKTSKKDLVDYFLKAGRNPEFCRYIYNVLYNVLEGGPAKTIQGSQEARKLIGKLEDQLATTQNKKSKLEKELKKAEKLIKAMEKYTADLTSKLEAVPQKYKKKA